jgi:copper chaperone CopZ
MYQSTDLPFTNPPIGRKHNVEKTVFNVPKMYADHHVKAVRETLLQLDGVEDVLASSAFKRVVVGYDSARLEPGAIEEALRAAGYGPGEDWKIPSPPEGKEDDSTWFKMIRRITETNVLDLQMSGDFRKY